MKPFIRPQWPRLWITHHSAADLHLRLTCCANIAEQKALAPPADVVADEAEARGARLFLHGTPEGGLGCVGHGVGLVQDDDLKRRARLPTDGKEQRQHVQYDITGSLRLWTSTADVAQCHILRPVA